MVATRCWSGAAAIAVCVFPTSVLAQGTWSVSPASGSPALVAYHAAVYDTVHLRSIVFGGFDTLYNATLGTWSFDGAAWHPLQPATSPAPRGCHAMVFDAVRQVVVMFGGRTMLFGNTGLDDTWEFDGTAWARRLPAASPSPRFEHAMAFDLARGTTVLFAGRSSMSTTLADTWLWNGVAWTQGPSGPPQRAEHAMSYDVMHDRTVMFGGLGPSALGDTWEWNGAAWAQCSPTQSPSGRCAHSLAYDLSRGVTVMYGGSVGGNETWEWDGTQWTPGPVQAYATIQHSLVFDCRLNRTTALAGIELNPFQYQPSVRTYGMPMTGTYQPIGTSCAGSAGTPVLTWPVASAQGPTIGASTLVFATPALQQTFFVFGWSDVRDGARNLPYDLAAFGMPGCTLQVSQDAVTSVLPGGSVAAMTTAIPNDPFLAGVRYHVQAFTLDLLANPGGFAATNHLLATVGRP